MPDRNELIASFEGRICGGEIHKGGYIHVPQEEAEAILELLKEQESRLLTIEEITGDNECWFESIYGDYGYADCRFESITYGYADCHVWTASKEIEVNRIRRKPEYVSLNDFMKKWRCWSARPTNEQRKAVKWNAAD